MGTSVEHGSHSFKWSLLLPLLETEYWDRKTNPLGQLSWSCCLYTSRQFLNACKLLTFTVCSTNVFHSFVNGAYFYVFLITLSFTPLMLWTRYPVSAWGKEPTTLTAQDFRRCLCSTATNVYCFTLSTFSVWVKEGFFFFFPVIRLDIVYSGRSGRVPASTMNWKYFLLPCLTVMQVERFLSLTGYLHHLLYHQMAEKGC